MPATPSALGGSAPTLGAQPGSPAGPLSTSPFSAASARTSRTTPAGAGWPASLAAAPTFGSRPLTRVQPCPEHPTARRGGRRSPAAGRGRIGRPTATPTTWSSASSGCPGSRRSVGTRAFSCTSCRGRRAEVGRVAHHAPRCRRDSKKMFDKGVDKIRFFFFMVLVGVPKTSCAERLDGTGASRPGTETDTWRVQ